MVSENWNVKRERASRLDTYFRRLAPFGFSGAVLLAQQDNILLHAAYGWANRAQKTPNATETVFNLGSVTKQFTAAAILRLETQAKLQTSDPLRRYLPETPADKAGISLHQLLSHTAGLTGEVGDDYELIERAEFLRRVFAAPLLTAPGEQYRYSNAGYSLLAAVIEQVSGLGYEEFLRQEFFLPLGMQSTGYRLPEWTGKVVARWYVKDVDNGTPLEKEYPSWNLIGNGDMLSTTGDLYTWSRALLGGQVLPPEMLQKMFTPNQEDYGYGWVIQQTPQGKLVEHSGASSLGSSADLRLFPDASLTVILFCNQSYGQLPLVRPLREKVEKIIFEAEVETPPENARFDLSLYDQYCGHYQLVSGGELVAQVENGCLQLRAAGQDAVDLFAFPEEKLSLRRSELNQQAEGAFQAALAGDFQPLGGLTANPKRRFERLKGLIQTRLQGKSFQSVRAFDCQPSSFLPDALDTYIALQGPEETVYFVWIWRGGKNIGLANIDFPEPPCFQTPFLLRHIDELVGYHLALGKSFSVLAERDENRQISGLVIRRPSGDVRLAKVS